MITFLWSSGHSSLYSAICLESVPPSLRGKQPQPLAPSSRTFLSGIGALSMDNNFSASRHWSLGWYKDYNAPSWLLRLTICTTIRFKTAVVVRIQRGHTVLKPRELMSNVSKWCSFLKLDCKPSVGTWISKCCLCCCQSSSRWSSSVLGTHPQH